MRENRDQGTHAACSIDRFEDCRRSGFERSRSSRSFRERLDYAASTLLAASNCSCMISSTRTQFRRLRKVSSIPPHAHARLKSAFELLPRDKLGNFSCFPLCSVSVSASALSKLEQPELASSPVKDLFFLSPLSLSS
jgi:hypothetical protein